MGSVTVAALTRHLVRKRSIATLVWDNDPEKRLAFPVAFGCTLEHVRTEAETALREPALETAALVVSPVG